MTSAADRDSIPEESTGPVVGFDSSLIVAEPAPDTGQRPVVSCEDLAGLVDVAGLTLAADGRWVAFRTQAGSIETNDHRATWHIAPTSGASPPVPVADAGRPTIEDGFLEGALHNGGLNPLAAWSPDGHRLAFQVSDDDGFSLWQTDHQGAAVRLTRLGGVLRALRYSDDGARLLFRTSALVPTPVREPSPPASVLVDPNSRLHAGLAALAGDTEPAEPVSEMINIATGIRRPATAAEHADLDDDVTDAELPGEPLSPRLSPDGSLIAYLDYQDDPAAPNLYVTATADPDRRRLVTALPVSAAAWTEQTPILWWAADGQSLYFQARTADRDLALFTVALDGSDPREVSPGPGDLTEFRVDPARGIAVCLESRPTRPAEVIAIDLRGGSRRTLSDLNPAWRHRRFGQVRRVEATNAYGDRTWAHLVYPPEFRPGQRYPMIITSYQSHGFLRGASGDEYPIHVLAARGFLVLDLTRPRGYEIEDDDHDDDDIGSAERFEAFLKDLDGPVSTIRIMIDILVREGIVDPDRIGICGLSNGSDIATYALQSTDLFRAAVLSGFSHDDAYTYRLYGPGYEDRWRQWGLEGGPDGPHRERWRRRSPGADKINAAVLSHDSESEYLESISAYTTMVQAGVPVELHVYPREDHLKIEPRHRLEIYRRTVDWLAFWLRDAEDPSPHKQEQYRRWSALRERSGDAATD